MWYRPNQGRRYQPHKNPYGSGIPWLLFVIIIWLIVSHFWLVILVGTIVTMIIFAIKNADQQNRGKNFQQTTYYQPPLHNSATGSVTSKQSPSSYQSYDQGYKTNQTTYQQAYTPFQHEELEQKPDVVYDEYDQPKAEYPQQMMPPM
jgi:hypothetical protein